MSFFFTSFLCIIYIPTANFNYKSIYKIKRILKLIFKNYFKDINQNEDENDDDYVHCNVVIELQRVSSDEMIK